MTNIRSWLSLMRLSACLIANLSLLVIAFLAVSAIGRCVRSKNDTKAPASQPVTVAPVAVAPVPATDWSAVNLAVVAALSNSFSAAEAHISKSLDAWTADVLQRVDTLFLPWYFNYWQQQSQSLHALYFWSRHKLIPSTPSVSDALAQNLHREFANRVIRPPVTQIEMERIARDAVTLYLQTVKTNLNAMRVSYAIPTPEWNRHLDNMAALAMNVDGTRTVSLAVKAVTVSSIGLAAVILRSLPVQLVALKTLTFKPTARLVSGAAGAALSAKMSARLSGVLAVALIVWEVWDHHTTKTRNAPILRRNLEDYIHQVRKALHEEVTMPVQHIQHELVMAFSRSSSGQ